MERKVMVLAANALVIAACSVTQQTTPATVQIDGAIAKTQASALTAAVASASANDGINVAETLGKVGDAAAALVPEAKQGLRERLRSSASTCGCAAKSTSCTFDACRIGNATVSGTLSWADGQIDCHDLTFDIEATSASVGAAHVSVSCALTYATGRLGGSLQTTGNAVGAAVTYSWNATLSVTDVTFTGDGFTGGSLDVGASITTSSASEGTKSFSANAVVSLSE
jgi:hypothetical protein